jgi:uncharacterized membrane protein
MLVVLWALGWALIALGALVFLPPTAVVVIGVVMIATHNLFDPISARSLGAFGPFWSILHAPGVVYARPAFLVFVAYPLIPWIGVTAVGYGLGQLYRGDTRRRQTMLLRLGIGLTLAFIVLRWINIYGDASRWAVQATASMTFVSFLNTTKYPPSLLFLLMTLGPALLMLWLAERGVPALLRPAVVYGRVPLFYFVLHLPLIHLIAVVICYARYGTAWYMFASPSLDKYPFTTPPDWGYSLPIVYLLWILVVVSLYPACVRYSRLKQRRRDWWLSYL